MDPITKDEIKETGYTYEEVATIVHDILWNEYDNALLTRQYSLAEVKNMIEASIMELFGEGDYEDDGQPSWEQEWEDFGEVYDDDPMRI